MTVYAVSRRNGTLGGSSWAHRIIRLNATAALDAALEGGNLNTKVLITHDFTDGFPICWSSTSSNWRQPCQLDHLPPSNHLPNLLNLTWLCAAVRDVAAGEGQRRGGEGREALQAAASGGSDLPPMAPRGLW